MGADQSTPALKGRLTNQLLDLIGRSGTGIRTDTAQEILKAISEFSPWFPITGSFTIADWDQVSKIIQGPAEPYPEFVDRLLEVASRAVGDINPSMPVLKMLAYENANRFCQEILRPHRNRSLDDYIHLCGDMGPPTIVGQVATSTPGEVPDGARPRICSHCGRPSQAAERTSGQEPGGEAGEGRGTHLSLATAAD